ncbi:nitroreductase [Nocardia macrotermitis]|uniref:Nitrobenzene nitroreductase n=1 Tax=Nocardia macrotermitis TaxID=2585198 RepID=A0A7K0CYK9_9NOCA|nr:nitroreductase [Nocardia macrotermitis]MQY18566.1 Nitrobenzene nitroreductase [Nocardia macrotermitis]
MDVYDAVRTRQSIRAFTAEPVAREVLERVLGAATRAPSGGNLQPWHIYVLTGGPLAELKKRVGERIASGDHGDEPEFAWYPPDLATPYRERLHDMGARRYEAVGIARDDTAGRARVRAENWNCFGASTALFCYLDRDMPAPQWADAGMYLQTVMLLFRQEGLHTCAQISWSEYHRTVAETIAPPPRRILFCGMAIGHPHPDIPHPYAYRAPLSETVTFLD